MKLRRIAQAVAATCLLLAVQAARAELKPDQLLLVVNGNSKDSVRIADFYVKARLIPEGRICKLDIPGTEEISFEVYEKNVVPVIRKFLTDNNLKDKVKCLVTFYGTPIRIAPIKTGPAEGKEANEIRTELTATQRRLITEMASMEQYVHSLDNTFTPRVGNSTIEDLAARADAAGRAMVIILNRTTDANERDAIVAKIKTFFELLLGEAGLVERFAEKELANAAVTEETKQLWKDRTRRVEDAREIMARATDHRYDPVERARLREAVSQTFGLFTYARVLQGQLDYFGSDQSGAAFDSELTLLWHDNYPRNKWVSNPLYYAVAATYRGPPVLMTARIDGSDNEGPNLLILGSLKAERDGLRGRIVIDSRGLHPNPKEPSNNSYAEYDQTLRNLYDLLRTKAKVPLMFDDREQVLPSGSVKGVAMYCGWYSVGNYVPCCAFVPGAVGFHVASFEMISLKDPKNNGWVKGLLHDGVCATTGPVAEPYLFAFPDADEFFPLILTGQLTLAEAYYKTQKTLSWQMSLVGDPLYRPYGNNPVLTKSDLPEKLQAAMPAIPPGPPAISGLPEKGIKLITPATQPSAQPPSKSSR